MDVMFYFFLMAILIIGGVIAALVWLYEHLSPTRRARRQLLNLFTVRVHCHKCPHMWHDGRSYRCQYSRRMYGRNHLCRIPDPRLSWETRSKLSREFAEKFGEWYYTE
jgi:hypothetical protein